MYKEPFLIHGRSVRGSWGFLIHGGFLYMGVEEPWTRGSCNRNTAWTRETNIQDQFNRLRPFMGLGEQKMTSTTDGAASRTFQFLLSSYPPPSLCNSFILPFGLFPLADHSFAQGIFLAVLPMVVSSAFLMTFSLNCAHGTPV